LVAAFTAAVSATALAFGAAAAPAQAAGCTRPVRQYQSPAGTDHPFGISAGPGGTWYARGGRLDLIPAGSRTIQQFPLPDANASAGWVGERSPKSQVVWFAERGTGRLGYVGPTIHVHEFQIPDGAAGAAVPQSIVFGAASQVYFTDQSNNRIGRLDASTGEFSFWDVPTPDSQPVGMTRGPEGDLYFSERGVDKVGRLDPATGLFTEWMLTAGAFPNRFAVTPDGNVWFTELRTDQLGYIDQTGHLHELATTGGPVGLTYYGGFLYAADFLSNELSQIDLSGAVTRTWTLPHGRGVLQLAASGGDIWVTDGFGHLVYDVDIACS
jgi:virginiamycin B lyase